MTRVTVKVISDSISKSGRHISISFIKTDNDVMNDFLQLPQTINKTYTVNESLQNIKIDMKNEIKSLVDSAKKTISTNKLVGKEITFNV